MSIPEASSWDSTNPEDTSSFSRMSPKVQNELDLLQTHITQQLGNTARILQVRARPWSITCKVVQDNNIWWFKRVPESLVADPDGTPQTHLDSFSAHLPVYHMCSKDGRMWSTPDYGPTLREKPASLPGFRILRDIATALPALSQQPVKGPVPHYTHTFLCDIARRNPARSLLGEDLAETLRVLQVLVGSPYTPVHNDLHDNNITDTGMILDWSDVSVTSTHISLGHLTNTILDSYGVSGAVNALQQYQNSCRYLYGETGGGAARVGDLCLGVTVAALLLHVHYFTDNVAQEHVLAGGYEQAAEDAVVNSVVALRKVLAAGSRWRAVDKKLGILAV